MDLQNATLVVQVPQHLLSHIVDSLQEIKSSLSNITCNASQQGGTPILQPPLARIPLTAFRENQQIAELYQLSYEKVVELAKNCLLRTYTDNGRKRFRWTTHEDIMAYIDDTRNMGIKRRK